MRDAVAERAHDDRRVIGKARRRVALRPAARVLERLRQVPVIQRHQRPDAGGQQSVDHAL